MVKFNHDAPVLIDSFNLTELDIEIIEELKQNALFTGAYTTPTKVIERLFVDERLSDNGKMWSVFCMGRIYELQKGEDNDKV